MKIEGLETQNLDHLGLVAALMKKMRLEEVIDSVIPKISNNAGISHGKVVCALILNGLGFIERRLYMVSRFFENKPIERLVGEGIKASDLNDDQIGMTLDALYNFGLTELFFYIWMELAINFKLFNPFRHLDSTTFTVHGKYHENENEIVITHGHSKDHRPDLKQITLNMGVTGKGGLPFWMEVLPGNSSDTVSFHETIKKFETFRNELGSKDFPIWVADAALYTAKRLLQKDINFLWITRVPERIKEARKILEVDSNKLDWTPIKEGHSYCSYKSNYCEIEQRWIMVFSEEAYQREIATFERNIEKEEDLLWKRIKELDKEIFFTTDEAEKNYKKLLKSLKYYSFSSKEIETVYEKIKGKTASGKQKRKIKGYKLKLIICRDASAIRKRRNTKGRYIVATNFLDSDIFSDKSVIQEYKNQGKVERGFRFLKDPSFLISDVYLKKTSRVQALVFIMALSLLVFNFGQYWIRKKLVENKKKIPNQINKPINNPTLKWIFQLMSGITFVKVKLGDQVFQKITNVNDVHKTVLECIGHEALKMYGFT